MQIQNNNLTFRGYDARPLRGLFLRDTNMPGFKKVASQLEKIGQKQGFDVFVQTNNSIFSKDLDLTPNNEYIRGDYLYTWCQDNLTFFKNGFISNPKLITKFGLDVEKNFGLPKFETSQHIAGGNYFVVDNNGKKELLLGQYHMGDLDKLTDLLDISSVKLISQADFHLDLFIRPLKDKTVLVADDKMWFDRINKIVRNIQGDPSLSRACNKLIEIRNMLCVMVAELPNSHYLHLSKIQEELTEAGYNVVKVPGRIFEYANDNEGLFLRHILNYMNAIVHVNKDNELVYITNKSNLNKYCGITENVAEKIGFDFQTEFINSLRDYVKPENIYFVDTQRFLKAYQGGVHCLASEIPKI